MQAVSTKQKKLEKRQFTPPQTMDGQQQILRYTRRYGRQSHDAALLLLVSSRLVLLEGLQLAQVDGAATKLADVLDGVDRVKAVLNERDRHEDRGSGTNESVAGLGVRQNSHQTNTHTPAKARDAVNRDGSSELDGGVVFEALGHQIKPLVEDLRVGRVAIGEFEFLKRSLCMIITTRIVERQTQK